MGTDRIEREIMIAAPVERVWEVVTRAEHVGAWFGDAGAEIDLRPGGAMVIRWTQYGVYHCVVEAVDPPRFFSFRGAVTADTDTRDGNSTLVEFTLEPADGGTRLRVVESGFDALDVSPDERRKFYEGNVEGWAVKLPELRDYAERVTT
jgi:uncharacterized protein YndB with AHSA1/START domain